MAFRAVFFDLDDTLCDESGAWQTCTAQTVALAAAQIPGLDPKVLADAYLEHSDAFWRALDPTKIPALHTVRVDLWERALRTSGHPDSPLASLLADEYGRRRRTHRVSLYPEATPLLSALRAADKTLILITNGVQETHLERIAYLGLGAYFHYALIADAVGFAKPDRRIFERALTLAGCPASQAAMVGDNPHTDIRGAHAVGISTFWYNPHGRPRPADVPPPSGGEVRTLPELRPRLLHT